MLDGEIVTPGVYDYASLSTLPPTTQAATYVAGASSGTGPWALLESAVGTDAAHSRMIFHASTRTGRRSQSPPEGRSGHA